MTAPRPRSLVWLAGAFLVASGCAPAVPLLSGGSTVPQGANENLNGAAIRVPLKKPTVPRTREARRASGAAPGTSFGPSAGIGGVVAVRSGRYGIAEHWDLELTVVGPAGRVAVRHEHVIEEGTTRPVVLLGGGIVGGWVPDKGQPRADADKLEGDGGWRLGGEVHAMYAVDFGGVYNLWAGARAGSEYVRGEFADTRKGRNALRTIGATALRAGPVLGLGLGFREVHFMIELSGYYEAWFGDSAATRPDRDGFVLVPAFALRLRL